MTNIEWAKRKSEAMARGVGVMTDVFVDRALNAEIWDVEGNRYIDFSAGIAVVNTGHCHPSVIKAVTQQLSKFSHTCHQVVPYDSYVRLGERLNQLVPGDFDKQSVFVTTGAEAVENSIKIARAATERNAVIAFSGGFHGRTFMAMALTGKVAPYKKDFGTLPGEIYHVPMSIAVHGIDVAQSIKAIEHIFKTELSAESVAAIIVEPVQGEGGFYPVPEELFKYLRQLCDENGMLLIADEVQTGFARTGKLFAMEHYSVDADLTTLAKGLAGGFPLAAVVGKKEVMNAVEPGGLGGTYGGSPIGIAAAHAVLDVIEDEDLCARANQLGDRLKAALKGLEQEIPEIVDVRGYGFMIAAEFNTKDKKKPNAEITAKIREIALRKGVILLTCGVYGNVIRFLAPLTIEEEVFEEAIRLISESISEACR